MNSAADALENEIDAGRYDQVRRLLSEGTDPNTLLENPETPAIDFALACGNHDIVRLLAEFGADIELVDSTGRTMLSRAASAGEANADVRLLLAIGADPNAQDSSGWTPLHFAAACGYSANLTNLLEAGASKFRETSHGLKAVDVAIRNNHSSVAELLADDAPGH